MQVVPLAVGVDDVGIRILRIEEGLPGILNEGVFSLDRNILVDGLGFRPQDAAELRFHLVSFFVQVNALVGIPDFAVPRRGTGSTQEQGFLGGIPAPVVAGLVARYPDKGARGQHHLDVAAQNIFIHGVTLQARGFTRVIRLFPARQKVLGQARAHGDIPVKGAVRIQYPVLLLARSEERSVDGAPGSFRRHTGQLVLIAAAQVAVDTEQPLVEAEPGLAVVDEVGVVHDQAEAVGDTVVADIKSFQAKSAELAVLNTHETFDLLIPIHLAQFAVGQYPCGISSWGVGPDLVEQTGSVPVPEKGESCSSRREFIIITVVVGRVGITGLCITSHLVPCVLGSVLTINDEIPQVAVGPVTQTLGPSQLAAAFKASQPLAGLQDVGRVHGGHVLVRHQVVQIHVVDVFGAPHLVEVFVHQAFAGTLLPEVSLDLPVTGVQTGDGGIHFRWR